MRYRFNLYTDTGARYFITSKLEIVPLRGLDNFYDICYWLKPHNTMIEEIHAIFDFVYDLAIEAALDMDTYATLEIGLTQDGPERTDLDILTERRIILKDGSQCKRP